MKIYSEKTKEFYDTEKECLEAEKEFDAAEKTKKEASDKLKAQIQSRAEEVKAAYEAAVAAQTNAENLMNKFLKDYGSFSMVLKDSSGLSDFFRYFNSIFFRI